MFDHLGSLNLGHARFRRLGYFGSRDCVNSCGGFLAQIWSKGPRNCWCSHATGGSTSVLMKANQVAGAALGEEVGVGVGNHRDYWVAASGGVVG